MDREKYPPLSVNERFVSTVCAICETEGDFTTLYREKIPKNIFNHRLFSARRTPDLIHFQIVKCNGCGLVRSNPIITGEALAQLYQQSEFTYDPEIENLKKTYGNFLLRLDKHGVSRGSLLEIGCGNGFLLEEALTIGFHDVHGVEPSADARSKAKPSIREHILQKIFSPGSFPPNSFDVVCLFHVLDHLPKPNEALKEIFNLLKPAGHVACIVHDQKSLMAKLLGERCPIYDIEHPYLYDRKTSAMTFIKNGFKIREIVPITNRYSLDYWLRLMPLPQKLKNIVRWMVKTVGLSALPVSFRPGNIGIIASK